MSRTCKNCYKPLTKEKEGWICLICKRERLKLSQNQRKAKK